MKYIQSQQRRFKMEKLNNKLDLLQDAVMSVIGLVGGAFVLYWAYLAWSNMTISGMILTATR